MFLKPQVTNQCAENIASHLNYTPALNWLTDLTLLKMSEYLIGQLRPYGGPSLHRHSVLHMGHRQVLKQDRLTRERIVY